MNDNYFKYTYLDETYETLCPLGEHHIFLAKNRDNGRIFVKKYVSVSAISVYERLITIHNKHLENIYSRYLRVIGTDTCAWDCSQGYHRKQCYDFGRWSCKID